MSLGEICDEDSQRKRGGLVSRVLSVYVKLFIRPPSPSSLDLCGPPVGSPAAAPVVGLNVAASGVLKVPPSGGIEAEMRSPAAR